ncbi:hypothetical protein C8Q74DRAFT_1215736 [Fomes fomentarius]|nr:hypothetical protein C8Q74DRAFT_1215736 [Fomes fomentarius]
MAQEGSLCWLRGFETDHRLERGALSERRFEHCEAAHDTHTTVKAVERLPLSWSLHNTKHCCTTSLHNLPQERGTATRSVASSTLSHFLDINARSLVTAPTSHMWFEIACTSALYSRRNRRPRKRRIDLKTSTIPDPRYVVNIAHHRHSSDLCPSGVNGGLKPSSADWRESLKIYQWCHKPSHTLGGGCSSVTVPRPHPVT